MLFLRGLATPPPPRPPPPPASSLLLLPPSSSSSSSSRLPCSLRPSPDFLAAHPRFFFPLLLHPPSSSFSSSSFCSLRGFASSGSSYFPRGIKPEGIPSSEKTQFLNRFDYADHPDLFVDDAAKSEKHPPQSSCGDLVESANHPHQIEGFSNFERYIHYNKTWEPVFQKQPDVSKGELVAGSNFYRTSAWTQAMGRGGKGKKNNDDDNSEDISKEPAIVAVSRFNPQNIRAMGYAENAPMPDSITPDAIPDFRTYRLPRGSPDRRSYTYFISASAFVATETMARSFVCAMVGFFWIPKGLIVAGIAEVDISKIAVGREVTVDYRGKPCFVKHRTPAQIRQAVEDDKLMDSLRDPELDSSRVQKPEWLVVSAVCTHLGCIPHEGGSYGGLFCPCHGSHYDTSGRIRAGPAPSNLVVPPYKFLDDNTIVIGD
eukprot:GHVS01007302.1.p1 GENE.GHVS01007302.1~~GHVS01007302.1.p1  ORF type:complete len:430 (-),score=78.61 GHVS01007302.1:495-1784(-)